jgi:hypothetical protein
MPTPPTISNLMYVIGENPYGQNPVAEYSSWGKLRGAIIKLKDNFSRGDNSLIIDEGFRPDDCVHIRLDSWPYTDPFDNSQVGPIYGFIQTGASPADDHLTLGRYYVATGSPTFYPELYSGADCLMDENDLDASVNGATLTFSGTSTVTATSDFYTIASDQATSTYGGQATGQSVTSVDGISGFTAF